MAGGMILMGVLVALISVPSAMITHGVIMMTANGWRAYLLSDYIHWSVFGRYLIGAAGGILLLFAIAWRPDKPAIYFILASLPVIVWIPKSWFHLDIRAPGQAIGAGFIIQAMNTLGGVAGPLLDIFFVNTDMTRQAIVATKSATQAISHSIKICFWAGPLFWGMQMQTEPGFSADLPPVWFLGLAAALAMMGTWCGKQILVRMSDANFQKWVRGLITLIGLVYLARAMGWV